MSENIQQTYDERLKNNDYSNDCRGTCCSALAKAEEEILVLSNQNTQLIQQLMGQNDAFNRSMSL
jgi:hypothetical protein